MLAQIAEEHPALEIIVPRDATVELLARVDALLARALPEGPHHVHVLGALDAIFESLIPRIAKGDKGQFFTPRHVVDFIVRALAPRARERVIDPACGSGAFLSHAHAQAPVATFGCDVDARAVRVARLSAIAQGRNAHDIALADGLAPGILGAFTNAHVIATNPPFAGRASANGFDVARVVRSPERDVLFLERSLSLLCPGGRLGIILPYNKAGGAAFAGLRRWLAMRARLYAVVGLPRETFLPHTSQRTFVLFAKKRFAGEIMGGRERTIFVVSKKAGKDKSGEPVMRTICGQNDGGDLDHDLDEVLMHLTPFLAAEGFSA